MANDLFEQMNPQNKFNTGQFMQDLNNLKKQGGDPNQLIQNMLNSGRISQSQLDMAVSRAQQIMRMLPSGGRR